MRFRLPSACLLLLVVLFTGGHAVAQEDSAPALGDLARSLRKNRAQGQAETFSNPAPVIDNDNFGEVMEDVKRARPVKFDKPVFSMDAAHNAWKLSSPGVTCSMSFNASDGTPAVKPMLIEDLPMAELLKLDGPGSIQDEVLQLELFNGTEWELQEVTVGLTLERKPGENAEVAARARVIPAAEGLAQPAVERRSDVTLLYHLKAEAKPFSTTAFKEDIGIAPRPDEDWRWSIVAAKGVRPSQVAAAPESLQEPLYGVRAGFLPETNQFRSPATPPPLAPEQLPPANPPR